MLEHLFPRNGPLEQASPQTSQSSIVQGNGHSTLDSTIPDEFWQIDEDAILDPDSSRYYELSIDTFFNARHFVVMQGDRGPLHSHSYRLRIQCRGRSLSDDDHVLVGYHAVRTRLQQVIGAYNDQILNELPPFERLQPTTEILAAMLFQQIVRILQELAVELTSVTVWESPTESITFRRQESLPGDVSP